MKATDLERIISRINRKYFEELCGPLPDGNAGDGKVASRRSPTSGKPICGDEGCFGGISSSPCFCGITKGGYHNGAELEEVIILSDPASNPPEGKVAVVATIDDATESTKEDKELPVVLAVGINYGQGANYLRKDLGLWDQTKMRTKLDKVFAALRGGTEAKCAPPNFPNPSKYHLVATNFFPWITQKPWSRFNSIEEMLLIYCHGFRDPFAHIKEIGKKLNDKLKFVVFHGAENAVPCLGAEFFRTRAASVWKAASSRPDIVFCENLAPSRKLNITNAVRLCGRRLHRGDVPDTFEE